MMAEKIIIEADGLPMEKALILAYNVVSDGRISDNGKCYCYATAFSDGDGGEVHVYASRNAKSDRLQVRKVK